MAASWGRSHTKTNRNIQIYGHIFTGIIFSSAQRALQTEQTQGGPKGKMKHKYFILEGGSDHSLTLKFDVYIKINSYHRI